MRRIVLNVISNAVKLTNRGEIRVIAATDSDRAEVCVAVVDTGIGIAPEQQPLLFEKFRQLDASHTRKHGRSGLGLAISKALIERMGGRIQVRSEGRGLGTTVTIAVPVAREARLGETSIKRTRVTSGPPSVLLMGQNTDARKVMAAALKTSGYMVRESATADGVRSLARIEQPGLLLIDLTAAGGPDTVGEWLDLLVTLRTDPQTRSIGPVVLIEGAAHAPASVQLELRPTRPTILDKPLLNAGNLRRMLRRIAASPQLAPLRVLVADDDSMVFKFVTSILPPHEYIVQHAASGSEVLRAVDAQQFDALLLDLGMSDESGYDVIRALKLQGRAPGLPILVITNYPEPTDADDQQLLSSSLILDVLSKATVAGATRRSAGTARGNEERVVKRVVIVEDNASVAKYFRYVLERGGHTASITESGDEAVTLAREADTVAVLIDVSLRATQYAGRYIDGLELSRILKEDQQTTRVPVIIATAHVMSGDSRAVPTGIRGGWILAKTRRGSTRGTVSGEPADLRRSRVARVSKPRAGPPLPRSDPPLYCHVEPLFIAQDANWDGRAHERSLGCGRTVIGYGDHDEA